MPSQSPLTSILTGMCLILCSGSSVADYDPFALPATVKVRTRDVTVRDEARSRSIPLRVYLPEVSRPAPVVLFSHGLGGTCKGSAYLGKHWSARGYVAVFMQHPGSDDSVWKDEPLPQRMAALKKAVSLHNFVLRTGDVSAVLDQLDVWNKQKRHFLAGRIDMQRVGMSGHSFGAATTQAASGQSYGFAGNKFTDKRIRAAIAMSPSSPRRGNPATAFVSVGIPWMLMAGTKDTAVFSKADAASRLKVYPHLPAMIDKYELVLHNAEHSAFSDRALPGDREKRNPNHHRAIIALSTAFWDAHLRKDSAALAWLHGKAVTSVLEPEDHWQFQSAK